jgi:transposase
MNRVEARSRQHQSVCRTPKKFSINAASGLAHLARTGFFKPVHVKSLSTPAIRSLLTVAFIDNALKATEGIAGLSVAMRGLSAARTAVMTAVAAIDADMRRMTRASEACRRLMTISGVG